MPRMILREEDQQNNFTLVSCLRALFLLIVYSDCPGAVDDEDDNGIIDDFVSPAAALLQEKHHGVLLASTTLLLEVCKMYSTGSSSNANMVVNNPRLMEILKRQVPLLIKILKALIVSSFASGGGGGGGGGGSGGISDPFLQVTILQLLRISESSSDQDNDALGDILAQVVSNINTSTGSGKQGGISNAGNAVLYECVKTIMGISSSSGGLRTMAINVLGKFLKSKDKNIRYVALNTLSVMVNAADGVQAVQRHRGVILDCVRDIDPSIRRRALDLVYSLVTSSNIVILAKELIDYMLSSGDPDKEGGLDTEFKVVLCEKICSLIEKLSPDPEWRIQTTTEILSEVRKHNFGLMTLSSLLSFIWKVDMTMHLWTTTLINYIGRTIYSVRW